MDWPRDEGVLGVIGVAPWSTLEFASTLYRLVDAPKDWHYPRVIFDINTKLPSRGRHLDLGEADFSPAIAASIRELADQGATVVVVTCNTAHVLYDRWAADAPVPVPNIIDATVGAALAQGGRNLAALGSGGLARFGTYAEAAARRGAMVLPLDQEQQALVWSGIDQVKVNGRMDAEMLARFDGLADTLVQAGADTILLACTELSELRARFESNGYRAIDSSEALAREALQLLRLPVERFAGQ
ncbi:aspartate/glutamate racemase family protein [Hephaestia sp. GCM10023244]|uniref:aspartate/glutamate racemase family protein n=1 Tax=unclassified Hephaestia TaxID=2631281 RepID=UPI0020772A0C|nr:aspartate/glutamate racemase family protein [Hephaestia sp. MAHUQ-44]